MIKIYTEKSNFNLKKFLNGILALYTFIMAMSIIAIIEGQAIAAYYGVSGNGVGAGAFSGIATLSGIFGGAAVGGAIGEAGIGAGFFAIAAAIPIWGWIAIGVAVGAA